MLLDDLLSQTRMVTVQYGDSELNVEYFRQRLTDAEGQRLMDGLQEMQGDHNHKFKLACTLLLRVIAWWDLYETEGIPLAVNAENLIRLPMSVITDVFLAIVNNETKPNLPTITVDANKEN